jgi:hypothetical protein
LAKAADNGVLDFDDAIDRLSATNFYASPDLFDRIRKKNK